MGCYKCGKIGPFKRNCTPGSRRMTGNFRGNHRMNNSHGRKLYGTKAGSFRNLNRGRNIGGRIYTKIRAKT